MANKALVFNATEPQRKKVFSMAGYSDLQNIEIIDTQSFDPTPGMKDGDIILVYGPKIMKTIQPPIGAIIVEMPPLEKIDKENFPSDHKKAVEVLDDLKKKLTDGTLQKATLNPMDYVKRILLKKSGRVIEVSEGPTPDILPWEFESFLKLIGKLNQEEVEIEFKNTTSTSRGSSSNDSSHSIGGI
jgi:hypothetical protein